MKLIPIALIIFGIILIAAPEIVGYLLGGLFIFLGINGMLIGGIFNKMKNKSSKPDGDDYVKFGNYKIYK